MGTFLIVMVLGFWILSLIDKHTETDVWEWQPWIVIIIALTLPFVMGWVCQDYVITEETIELEKFKVGSNPDYVLMKKYIVYSEFYIGFEKLDDTPGSKSVIMPVDDSEIKQDLSGRVGYVIKRTHSRHMPKRWMGWFFINSILNKEKAKFQIHLLYNGLILFP